MHILYRYMRNIYVIDKRWLIGDHLLLTDFEPCGIMFVMRVLLLSWNDNHLLTILGLIGNIIIAVVIMLRPYGIIFMTMCVYYFRFSRHS
jgi:hypothetical protein